MLNRQLRSLFSTGQSNDPSQYTRTVHTTISLDSESSSKAHYTRRRSNINTQLHTVKTAAKYNLLKNSIVSSPSKGKKITSLCIDDQFSYSAGPSKSRQTYILKDTTTMAGVTQNSNRMDTEEGASSDLSAEHDQTGVEEMAAKAENSSERARIKPIEDFREARQDYLDQFFRLETTTKSSDICSICSKKGQIITCRKCFQFSPRCQDCFVKAHQHAPLHVAHVFNGFFWERETLRNLGLVVHLGHDGGECPGPNSPNKKRENTAITVIDLDGIQEVSVQFCSCEQCFGINWMERNQFIAVRWFPATSAQPRTVTTFDALDKYEAITFQGKTAGYHFYQSLVRLTDATGCTTIPKRYEQFVLSHREYQHIKMLQRAGVSSILGGVSAVKEGELGIECPACPCPKKNLPDDWDKAHHDAWLYTQYVMVDANFRLKQKAKGLNDDEELVSGSAYFVEEKKYKRHLSIHKDEPEIKVCTSGFKAVDHANLRGGKGYDASGVVAVQCRHMLVRRNGVGDLQKGERYANVDYTLLSALEGFPLKYLTISYDIACQYHQNLSTRISQYSMNLQLAICKLNVEYVIPKFHIAGHGDKCRTRYSLNYRENMGRTDGENIERGWAALNPLSMASKEMGRGTRHDILDFHVGDWNYQRVTSFGRIFSKRLTEAVKETLHHKAVLVSFSNAFPGEVLKEIEIGIKNWNADPDNNPDPYAEAKHGTTLLEVRRSLAQSEEKEMLLAAFDADASDIAISASQWLVMGLELEDAQSSIRRSYGDSKADKTTVTKTVAEEKNVNTNRRIQAWQSIQMRYMPGLVNKLPIPEVDEEDCVSFCWEKKLHLPSSLELKNAQLVCAPGLIKKEALLRQAQAEDALSEVRRLLQKQWWLTKMKKKHVAGPGQKINTRSNAAIQALRGEREKHVERYRNARIALSRLEPGGSWKEELRVLRDEDVKPLEDDDGGAKGEGRRSPSWIWGLKGAAVVNEHGEQEIDASLRVEWAKSRARVLRWLEELTLVKEEMRRVLCYFRWKADWWLGRALTHLDNSKQEINGYVVYANRQASILQNMAAKFRLEWESVNGVKGLPVFSELKLLHVQDVQPLQR